MSEPQKVAAVVLTGYEASLLEKVVGEKAHALSLVLKSVSNEENVHPEVIAMNKEKIETLRKIKANLSGLRFRLL